VIRPFPIKSEMRDRHGLEMYEEVPAIQIPWVVAECAYQEKIARYPEYETLEEIAKMGGFSRDELLDLLDGWVKRCGKECIVDEDNQCSST
jgi:hypothetical protein